LIHHGLSGVGTAACTVKEVCMKYRCKKKDKIRLPLKPLLNENDNFRYLSDYDLEKKNNILKQMKRVIGTLFKK